MKIRYENLRDGDIVCTTGKGFLGRIISRITGDRTSKSKIATHVGIVVKWRQQFYIAELLANGLQISTFERYTEKKRHWILEINRPLDLGHYERNRIANKISEDNYNQISYDFKGVLGFINPNIKQNPHRWFCSEYVAFLLENYGGIDLDWEHHRYAPSDFQCDSKHLRLGAVEWIK